MRLKNNSVLPLFRIYYIDELPNTNCFGIYVSFQKIPSELHQRYINKGFAPATPLQKTDKYTITYPRLRRFVQSSFILHQEKKGTKLFEITK
jgi:hypothetical protein